MNHPTLLHAIHDLLDRQPDSPLLVMHTPTAEAVYTVRQFVGHAATYADALRQSGIQPGDLVALVLQHGQDVLFSFWGALLIGAVPSIFPFLTEKLDKTIYFDSLAALTQQEGIRTVITYDALQPTLTARLGGIAGLRAILNKDDLPLTPDADPARQMAQTNTQPGDTAFLQHSSGSTGLQKGVMLSHQAVLNQLRAYGQAIRLSRADVVVSWLPLYHDMGLIAGFILPVVYGLKLVLMSPFDWVRDPKMLLHAASTHRGTLCWLPNFAYNFMASRIRPADLAGVDLSSLRAVVNCSEPVQAASHDAFLTRFAPYGLRANALTTCYAMAENTFAVTQGSIHTPPTVDVILQDPLSHQRRAMPAPPGAQAATQTFVSNGKPIPNTQIMIVDDHGHPLPERHIGEVMVQSDCMLTGYYARPDLTAAALRDGWYITGDMGYMAGGELYITGRKKDLIIVGGKNIYPQDIEHLLNDLPGVHPGRVVCFGVPNDDLGTEDIAIIAEVADGIDPADRAQTAPILRGIRARIAQQTHITARYVQLVGKGWLIKTSSGKIARSANRDKFLHG